MNQRFPKSERLKKRKDIGLLFSSKKSFTIYPYKVFWRYREDELEVPVKLAVSVPKRNFKKAVDRNLLKRRSIEAYRINKSPLHEALLKDQKGMNLMLVYIAKNKIDYVEVQHKIILILQRLAVIDR